MKKQSHTKNTTHNKHESHGKHSDENFDHKSSVNESSEDLKLNMDWFGNLFKKVNLQAVIVTLLILSCMFLVMYVRMLPSSLPVTDDWAANTIQQNVRSQIGAQVDAEFPALPQKNRDALVNKRVDEFIAQNGAQYAAAQQQLSEQFKTYMRYTADDGKEYTYLGDLDSYFWLRYTRNVLRHGTVCDTERDGQCIDNHMLAPYGTTTYRNPSIHVFAILGLYKVFTLFNSGYPLPAAAFLIPVLVGMLGVIPAFFIGRRLAGNVGGVFAAILISLNPLLLSRSMGSDNDVWNVIIPLFIMWMIIEALEAKSWKLRITYATLSAVFVGIQAAAWDAWWFAYLLILVAIVCYLIFKILTMTVRDKNFEVWKNKEIIAIFAVIMIFYIGSFLAMVVNQRPEGYFAIPLKPFTMEVALDSAIGNSYWPNVLTTVAELNKSSFTDAISNMGGTLFFFGCMIGMLLLVLPKNRWNWKHYTLLLLGAGLSAYAINTQMSKIPTLIFVALPIISILLLYFFEEENADIAAAMIVLVWFLGTIYATYSGVRFILLMIPAFGIGFAVLAGRAYEWITGYLNKETNLNKYLVNIGVFLVIILLLIQPVRAGYYTAKNFVPSIDDAWWDTLKKIEAESAPDAIINSWWDFGHWFKYVADRRVTADGTSQHTHVPRWLGLSLVTTNEDEAMGTLRMLTCGSDVYPDVPGKYGAYGQFLNKTNDPILAQQMVRDIIVLEKGPAREYLKARGFNAQEQDKMLNATHCNPPEDYFITSGDMVGKAGVWAHFGLWNFTRAYIAEQSKNMTREEAVADFTRKFNMTADAAEQLYFEAKALSNENEINAFAAPWPGYVSGNWMQCYEKNITDATTNNNGNSSSKSNTTTVVICPLNIRLGQQNGAITSMDAFIYDMKSPEKSVISYGVYQNGQKVGGINNGTPSLLVVAKEDKMQDLAFENPTSNVALVYDVPNRRVLVTDPLLAKSMFTQLFYLEGRYSNHFVKFDDRTSFTGSRVLVWKVDWDGIIAKNSSNSVMASTSKN